MEEKNRELLNKVIEDRLTKALQSDVGVEDYDNTAFKEAMDAVNKQIDLYKADVSYQEWIDKLENEKAEHLREEDQKKEETKLNHVIHIATFAAGILLPPVLDIICKTYYAKRVCEYEQTDTFTTSAGRGISTWFRFKN